MKQSNNAYISKILTRSVKQLRSFQFTKKYIDQILGNTHISELVKGSGIAFIFKILSLPLGLATSLIISRRYGAEAMGLYGLITTVVGILVSIGMLGLGVAMPRFLGESRALENNNEPAIYRTSVRMILISGLVCSGLLYFCSSVIAESVFHEPKLVFPLQIASLFIIPLMRSKLNESFLLASKHIYHAELINKALIPISMLCIVFASYWIWPTHYIPIWAYLCTGALGMIVSLYILWEYNYVAIRGTLFDWKKLLKVSGPMLITGMASLLIIKSDIFMLGIYTQTQIVGVYTVVFSLAALISFPQMIVATILGPKISELYYQKKHDILQKTLTYSVGGVSIIALCITVSILIGGEFILGFYGQSFLLGKNTLFLLSIGLLFGAVTGSTSTYLNNTGREKVVLNITVVMLLLNVVGNAIYIPIYGMYGSAIVSIFVLLITNIYTVRYIYIHDHIIIDASSLFRKSPQ